jgi:uncharacterized protein
MDTADKRTALKTVDIIAIVLLIVGAINWGLWGAFEFDLVAAIFGGSTAVLSKIVYVLVGLAGIYEAITYGAQQRRVTRTSTTTTLP